jgi:hypothetical protein
MDLSGARPRHKPGTLFLPLEPTQAPGLPPDSLIFCGGRPKYRGGARKIFNDCGLEYSSNSDFGPLPAADTLKTLKKLRAPSEKSG